MAGIANGNIGNILFTEQGSTPSTPAAGKWRLFFKSDGIYIVDDAGNETGPLTDVSGLPTGAEGRDVLHESTIAGAADRFDVGSISGAYKHLFGRARLRSSVAAIGDSVRILLNGDTTLTNYRSTYTQVIAATPGYNNTNAPELGFSPGNSSPANSFGSLDFSILDYAGSHLKVINFTFGHNRDGGVGAYGYGTIYWASTAAINQITIQPDGYSTDKFAIGSYLQLIGSVQI